MANEQITIELNGKNVEVDVAKMNWLINTFDSSFQKIIGRRLRKGKNRMAMEIIMTCDSNYVVDPETVTDDEMISFIESKF